MAKIYAYFDTNLWMHYLFPDQVDWVTLLGADEVYVVLSRQVTRELDKHKWQHPIPKLKRRAKDVLARLDNLLEQEDEPVLEKGVWLVREERRRPIEYADFMLDPTSADDVFIAGVLAHRRDDPDASLIVVSADSGPRNTARDVGLTLFRPRDEDKLPDELDPLIKRNRELEHELTEARASIPSLRIAFEDGEMHLIRRLREPAAFAEGAIESIREQIRAANPYMDYEVSYSSGTLLAQLQGLSASINSISNARVNQYNFRLDTYYADYERTIHAKLEYENLRRRTVPLHLVLANVGTCPAKDVTIILSMPEGCQLYAADDLPKEPVLPTPPKKPKPDAFPYLDDITYRGISPFDRVLAPRARENVEGPNVTAENPRRAIYSILLSMHGIPLPLPGLYLVFESFATATSISIDGDIHAGNLPKKKAFRLGVQLKMGTN